VENKRWRGVRKGGDIDWLHLQSGSARLLPRLIGDCEAGPIFLADRPARPRPRARLHRPVPGHRPSPTVLRTGRMPVEANSLEGSKGWTRHQLRHFALTHLAKAGVSLPLLMAKTGHQHLRSLHEYARPGAEAVAAVTAAHDPARRRQR
jgi:integrase